jgi:fibronectin-binding autotransporter adhesin
MRNRPGPIKFAAFLLSLLFTPALLANGYPTIHWLGANGTSWTAGNNWSSDSSGSSPVDFSPDAYTIFSATGSANSSATNLGGDQSVSSLTIAVPEPVGLGGGTLTVNGPVQIQTGTLTIGGGGGLVVAGSTPVPQTINALFAANNGANTVSVYNLDNSNLFVTSLGTGVLVAPTVLSADADGNLHVLNGTTGATPKVSVFAPNGTLLREVNSPGFPATSTPGFAVGQNGTLQLSDTAANLVKVFDSIGTLLREISTGLDGPIGLATGANGTLYVANTASSSISIFNPDGTPFGNATASFPSVLAVSSNGTIYAPGGGVGDAIIELFFPNGLPAGNITVSNSRNIKGLAVAPDGSFYASYEGSPAIHAFAPDGTPTGQITENLLSPYGLWTGNFTTETLQFNGITLAASSSDTATLNIGTFGGNDTTVSVAAHSIQFGAGTATMNLNLAGDFTLAAPLTGGGLQSTINKFGTGTTTLASADSTYAGAIHIHAGTLAITGSVANSSTAIHTGGTLAGDGILGSVEVHNGGTIAPGASSGTSTLTMGNTVWNGGGIFELQFASANGTPGSDWDFLSSTGSLTVNSTSGDKFVINATAQEGSGFDPAAESYKWQIANFSGNITGFAPEKFQILASGFNGSTGTFSVSANSTSLALNYRTLFVWSGGNGSWSVQTDWLDNAAPVEGGPIQFAGPGGISTNDSLSSIASLAFTANATGSYTLDGGNLTLGSGGLTNNSQHSQTIALNLAFSEDQTFAATTANLVVIGNITGAASLAKTGNQSLVLSGANALSGNTTVFSGELAITAGSLATQELQVGNGGNGTLHLSGGTIEAAGSLIALFENSPGTATVTGGTWNNTTYLSVGEFGIGTLNLTGGTVSVGNGTGTLDLAREVGSVGTLNIGTGTTSGTLSVANVTAGEGTASVNFHHNGDLVFTPVLTGNLALTQLGTGTTTLTAANTHTGGTTITSGTLQIGNGGSTGFLIGDISNESALVFNRSNDLVFSGAISGNGSLTKLGAGTLTLTGIHSLSGPTSVAAGELRVNGSLADSAVDVASGASLSGSGLVGILGGNGSIHPGNSQGILTAAALDSSGGLDFHFEFTGLNPVYSNATASTNDVLRLTAETLFSAPLDEASLVNIYFHAGALEEGQFYTGGFFTDEDIDFLGLIDGAAFHFYLQDAAGAIAYGGQTYSPLGNGLAIQLATLSQTAAFADGTVNGRVLQMEVIPEPSTWTLLALAAALLAAALSARKPKVPGSAPASGAVGCAPRPTCRKKSGLRPQISSNQPARARAGAPGAGTVPGTWRCRAPFC